MWFWSAIRPIIIFVFRLGILAALVWILFFADFLSDYRNRAVNTLSAGYLNLLDGNGLNFDVSKSSLYCEKRRLTLSSMKRERDGALAIIDKEITQMERNKWQDAFLNTAPSSTNSGALANLGRAMR